MAPGVRKGLNRRTPWWRNQICHSRQGGPKPQPDDAAKYNAELVSYPDGQQAKDASSPRMESVNGHTGSAADIANLSATSQKTTAGTTRRVIRANAVIGG